MTPRKTYLLTPKLPITYQPAWLPILSQKILNNKIVTDLLFIMPKHYLVI